MLQEAKCEDCSWHGRITNDIEVFNERESWESETAPVVICPHCGSECVYFIHKE